jgi:hypothetical protein
VATLGHVRSQSTLEIPIAEAWELLQECDAQASLKAAPEAQQPSRNAEFEAEQHSKKDEQQPHAPEALFRQLQHPAKVKEPPKQQGLHHHAPAREGKRSYKGSRREEAIGPQEAYELATGSARWLCEGGHQLRRERRRSVLAVRLCICYARPAYRPSPAYTNKHHTLEDELFLTV